MHCKTISPIQVKELLLQNKIQLIDVREPEEYWPLHIETAELIPLNSLLYYDMDSYNREIVFYCKSGIRSAKAAQFASERFPELTFYSMAGGILSWQEQGFPTINSANNINNTNS